MPNHECLPASPQFICAADTLSPPLRGISANFRQFYRMTHEKRNKSHGKYFLSSAPQARAAPGRRGPRRPIIRIGADILGDLPGAGAFSCLRRASARPRLGAIVETEGFCGPSPATTWISEVMQISAKSRPSSAFKQLGIGNVDDRGGFSEEPMRFSLRSISKAPVTARRTARTALPLFATASFDQSAGTVGKLIEDAPTPPSDRATARPLPW